MYLICMLLLPLPAIFFVNGELGGDQREVLDLIVLAVQSHADLLRTKPSGVALQRLHSESAHLHKLIQRENLLIFRSAVVNNSLTPSFCIQDSGSCGSTQRYPSLKSNVLSAQFIRHQNEHSPYFAFVIFLNNRNGYMCF